MQRGAVDDPPPLFVYPVPTGIDALPMRPYQTFWE